MLYDLVASLPYSSGMLRPSGLFLLFSLTACRYAPPTDLETCAILVKPAAYLGRTVKLVGAVWLLDDRIQLVTRCPDGTAQGAKTSIPLEWRSDVEWGPPTGGAAPVLFVKGTIVNLGDDAHPEWKIEDARPYRVGLTL